MPAASRGGSGTAVMAVAARHADTEAIYHAFDEEGMSVEAIDVQACAIARAGKPRLDATGVTPVLDLGHSHAASAQHPLGSSASATMGTPRDSVCMLCLRPPMRGS